MTNEQIQSTVEAQFRCESKDVIERACIVTFRVVVPTSDPEMPWETAGLYRRELPPWESPADYIVGCIYRIRKLEVVGA